MGRVDGKVAVVTGAAGGIGEAICRTLGREGATVAVTDVRDPDGGVLASEIGRTGGTARYWHLDVTVEDEVRRVLDEVVETFGRMDVLVNNAGIAGVNKPTHAITEVEWDCVQSVNVKGVFFCTKHAIRYLRQSGHASIINLSSICGGRVGATGMPPCHAAAGAVRLMTKTDALVYAADRIRVNSVHPGFIWTPMLEQFLAAQGGVGEGRQMLDAMHPLGHIGEPCDIAMGVLYLSSDESRFITAAELVIDGGYTAR
jgi:NAD(P)-dependent dehydrogenase (short-subunit alcohol dehydrogenase family)